MHYKISAFDCPSAWYKVVKEIYSNGITFMVENGSEVALTKKLNITLQIEHPEIRPLIDELAPTDMKYVNEYVLRYLWLDKEEALDDSEYTYSDRLRHPVDQIKSIIYKYKKTINDRQATMVIRNPFDVNNENPPCLSLIDTEILDNKLHLTCYFRSWDAYGGLCSNIAGIQLFNEALVEEINSVLNTDITTGNLIFHCKNVHIYERCFELIKKLNEKVNKK